ncbi:hypothetical protein DB459_01045 [Bradyrhizobium sp. WD16]|nr:hypothetical protein DB459_01045 [Bradyrhizobium sp. WD16]
MADAAFGVEAAARQFGLDFIRLLTEDHVFVCRKSVLDGAPMQRLLAIIRSAEFRDAIDALPGYAASDSGTVSSVKAFFDRA